MNRYLLFAFLLTAFTANAQHVERIRFTHYAHDLGLPRIEQTGDVSFSGFIRISGVLRIEVDKSTPELCSGACAYLVPDATSMKRLPRPVASHVDRNVIQLYDANPILVEMLGRRRTNALLGQNASVIELPVTFELIKFRLYGACSGLHYEAAVRNIVQAGEYVVLAEHPHPSGC